MRHRPTRSTVVAALALGVGVVLLAAGCGPSGPLTSLEALELRQDIEDLQDRLSNVESMLANAQNDDLPDGAQRTLSNAETEISEVVASLTEVRDALEMPQPQPASDFPETQPAPSGTGGAGGGM